MWSMAEPIKLLYAITYPNIEEIKISPGIMLVVFKKQQNFVRAITAPRATPPMRHAAACHAQSVASTAGRAASPNASLPPADLLPVLL
jgi:hypothetical protein